MEFCSICTASFDADDRRIRCCGQRCDQAFHQRCVHLTMDHVRSWLVDDVGLFWFCSTCRLEFAEAATSSREDRKRKLDEEEAEPTAVKQSRMDPSLRLPPEVWTMIFQHLDSRWLARVRLVCRDWNEMVTCRSDLMDRFWLKLRERHLVDDLEEVRHFLGLSKGFTKAEFDFTRIKKDKPRFEWFTSLGESLTSLNCKSMPFAFLYELLRSFTNLKRLTIEAGFEYGKLVKPNYKLSSLEELTITNFNNKKRGELTFRTLQHVCPRITVLKLPGVRVGEFVVEIAAFVRAVYKTLQVFEVSATRELINELVKVDDIQLKRLSISCSGNDLVRLLRRWHTVESLHFRSYSTDIPIINEIHESLPSLKELKLNSVGLRETSPLSPMNLDHVESFQIEFCETFLSVAYLNYCHCYDLRHLDISNAYLPSNVLENFRKTATQISSVRLKHCKVDRTSDILSLIQQSKWLVTFEIYQLDVKSVYDTVDTANGHANIRHLKLHDESKKLLSALAELCPDLESLDIEHELREDDVAMMGQKFNRLKSLTMHVYTVIYRLSCECLQQIPTGFDALRKLRINACTIPKYKVQKALQGLRKDVEVSVEFW